MKRYRKCTETTSSRMIALAILFFLIVAVIIAIVNGIKSEGFIILISILITLICLLIINKLSVAQTYSYFNNYINLYYLCVRYKKIKYYDYSYAVISNASYNMGYGYSTPNVDRPMQYVVETSSSRTKVTYPFISLHTNNFPLHKIKKELTSRELFFLKDDEICCLGICWFDSFEELLSHTDMDVYILEDVYLRFQYDFDITISRTSKGLERFYIVLDNPISYKEYCKTRKTGDGNQGTVL